MVTVDVLGTKYSIKVANKVDDVNLESCDGYCDPTTKTITIGTFIPSQGSVEDLESYRKSILRHELVHAFLNESGLNGESWGRNEEIVDWIAYQFPKILKVFESCGAL